MTLPLPMYNKVKNNYCICYLHNSIEQLKRLIDVRKELETKYNPINIYICCKDNLFDIIKNNKNTFKYSELKNNQNEFAHIFNLKFNDTIDDFIKENL